MAAGHPPPALTGAASRGATSGSRGTTSASAGAQDPAVAERALVPAAPVQMNPNDDDSKEIVLGAPVAELPVELEVAIPVREFRVRDLLALEPGRLIESQWSNGVDLPLAAGDVQLAWSEFEVIDTQLVVRVIRLA